MYTIWIDGQSIPLHNNFLQDQGSFVIGAVVETQLNAHGSLTFQVVPQNPLYDSIQRLITHITVKDNNDEIWRGRVLSVSRGIENLKTVYCEGEMGYLCDSIKPPTVFQGTISDFFSALISNHNSQMVKKSGESMVYDSSRRFTVGNVTVAGDIDIQTDAADTTWNLIGRLLIQQHGGYVQTRKVGSTVYIDYLADFDAQNVQQSVEYGKNMIDFSEEIDAADVITQMYAYGAKKSHAPRLYKQSSGNNFVLHTGDIEAGKYLFVLNGCAMNNTLSSGKLGSTLVTINNDTIVTPQNGDLVWQISESSVDMSESVSVSGSTSSSMTFSSNYIDEDGDAQTASVTSQQSGNFSNKPAKVGGSLDGATDGSFVLQKASTMVQQLLVGDQRNGAQSISVNFNAGETNVSVSSTETRRVEWLIKSVANNKYLFAALAAPGKLYLDATVDKIAVWKINNGETGTTVNNVQKSNDKEFATLYGDLDAGFWLAQSTSADKNLTAGTWDADRVTAQKSSNGSAVVISADGIALWGLRIWGTKVFEEATTPQEVLAAAQAYLARQIGERLTIETTAADLSLIYPETTRFDVGMYSQVRSWLHDLNIRMLCTHVVRYLDEPEKTEVTFGVGKKTLSDIQGGLIVDVS